jgi:polyisoprenoid-binding protein YceI
MCSRVKRRSTASSALVAVCALLFAAAAPAFGQEIALEFDPARTTVEFTVADVLHTVHGSFRLKRGYMRFDAATGQAAGEIVVDAASGDSGSHGRDSRMNKNVLESERYPDIIFRPDRVQGTVAPQGESQVQVHGTFEIHGGQHELTVPVHVEMSSREANATMTFAVPYAKWGMKNPSTFILRVSDKVDIRVRAVATVTPVASRSSSSAPVRRGPPDEPGALVSQTPRHR